MWFSKCHERESGSLQGRRRPEAAAIHGRWKAEPGTSCLDWFLPDGLVGFPFPGTPSRSMVNHEFGQLAGMSRHRLLSFFCFSCRFPTMVAERDHPVKSLAAKYEKSIGSFAERRPTDGSCWPIGFVVLVHRRLFVVAGSWPRAQAGGSRAFCDIPHYSAESLVLAFRSRLARLDQPINHKGDTKFHERKSGTTSSLTS